ncbi:MAG: type I 3-dehydroquinate dehydratase [Archaeoglobi archaeon]|nr:type I 3-dehydroquinate dehydratase [Candidatus Mnemosynella bozhongmuii]
MEERSRKESSKSEFSIVASLLGDDAPKELDEAERYADILELRIDAMSDETVREIQRRAEKPLILTFRRRAEGGFYEGDEESRKERILSLLPLSDFVDIEINSEIRDEIIEACRREKIRCIVSFHDMKETPPRGDLERIVEDCLNLGDIAKIAVRARSYRDVLTLLNTLLEFRGSPLCMISMGEIGKHSRVIAPLYGSVLTYGCLSTSAAPGQIHVRELREMIEKLLPQ